MFVGIPNSDVLANPISRRQLFQHPRLCHRATIELCRGSQFAQAVDGLEQFSHICGARRSWGEVSSVQNSALMFRTMIDIKIGFIFLVE